MADGFDNPGPVRRERRVRWHYQAAARRAGHADLTYGVYGVTGRYVNDLDAAAGAVANTPTG